MRILGNSVRVKAQESFNASMDFMNSVFSYSQGAA